MPPYFSRKKKAGRSPSQYVSISSYGEQILSSMSAWISGIASVSPGTHLAGLWAFQFRSSPSGFHTVTRDSYCGSSTCTPVEIFPRRRFRGHYGIPISWMISWTKVQWRERMANAIHEKWKNNWPDAYGSPVAFREYITETEKTYHTVRLAQFIPALVYLRSILLYVKMPGLLENKIF